MDRPDQSKSVAGGAALQKQPKGTAAAQLIVMFFSFFLLGVANCLRGTFLPVFRESYGLTSGEESLVISIGYAGNIFFLFAGGNLMDRLTPRKRLALTLALWSAAWLTLSFTRQFLWIPIGLFTALGTGAVFATAVRMLAAQTYPASAGRMLALLQCTNGLGLSAGQFVVGRFAQSLDDWRRVVFALFCGGTLLLLLVPKCDFPDCRKKRAAGWRSIREAVFNKAMLPLVLLETLYMISDNSVLNWFTSYATHDYQMSRASAASVVSVFYAGIMLGCLLLGPLVDKIGAHKSMILFSAVAFVLCGAGVLCGRAGVPLIAVSGLAYSILPPTIPVLIERLWPAHLVNTATGYTIACASLVTIRFNNLFVAVRDAAGYRAAFSMSPLAMGLLLLVLLVSRRTLAPADKPAKTAP